MKLTYTAVAVDAVKVSRKVTIDGETYDAIADGLSIQLVSESQPTISLNLVGANAEAWEVAEGDEVVVTFGGAK